MPVAVFIRVPCGIQPAEPHIEWRKASLTFCKPWLGLGLGEQETQTPGLCRWSREIGTSPDVPLWILRDGRRDHVHDVELLMNSGSGNSLWSVFIIGCHLHRTPSYLAFLKFASVVSFEMLLDILC